MKKTLLLAVVSILACALNSCGTIKGIGSDIQKAGGAISNTASRAAN